MSTTVANFITYKYVAENMVLPPSIQPYCVSNGNKVSEYYKGDINTQEVKNLLNSHMVRQNRNDTDKIISESVTELLNKITTKNYNIIVESLKNLNYSNKKHIYILAEKLIIKSSTDQQRSDLYALLCKNLSDISKEDISFMSALLNIAKDIFEIKMGKPTTTTIYERTVDYVNIDLTGYMKFISDLFNKKIINDTIVRFCYTHLLTKINNQQDQYYDPFCIFCKNIVGTIKLNQGAYNKIKDDLQKVIAGKFNKMQYKFKIQEVLDVYV